MKRLWLKPFSWEMVTEINRRLCEPKEAMHGPTSDGHETTKELWNSQHSQPMSLADVIELCRRCHRFAPFCNYNGNTFVAIIRQVIGNLNLPGDETAVRRSLAGHIVAGIASQEEQEAFTAELKRLSIDSPESGPT